MRLFIALNLSNLDKDQVNEIKDILKTNSNQGKFVNKEHMHITVEFLGEISEERVDLIKNLMNEIEFEAFKLKLNRIGYFKRREGNIYWLGIEKNQNLTKIHDVLHKSLKEEGFKIEDRDFKPHLTLGRRVRLKPGFNTERLDSKVEEIEIDIKNIDLVKSEFTEGKLKYSIIYSKNRKI